MKIYKVVLYLYALIIPVYLSDSKSGIVKKSITEYDGNCMCYPKSYGYTTINEIMDPQGNKLERVVIYIYRDMDKNEIKMYTPNKDKQLKIPDLPFEIGDGLITLNKEIASVFHANPNIIKISDVKYKVKDDYVVKPIGLMTGDIEEVIRDIDLNDPDFIVQDGNNPKKYPIPYSIEEITNIIWPKVINKKKNSNILIKPRPTKGVKNIPNVKSRPWNEIQNGNYYQNWHHLGHDAYWEISSELPNYYNIGENYSFETPNTEIYTPNVDIINNHLSDNHYLNFDQWFIQQMKQFRHTNLPGDINNIDTVVLRSLLEKTLEENNMFVTTNGILIDSVGNVLDIANLELRPLLLGNSVGYDEILQGGSGSKLKLPIDLPYLEGILVTLVYPPKVLGIIPLGKTYLSPSSSENDGNLKELEINKYQVPHKVKLNKQTRPSVLEAMIKIPKRPTIKHHHAPAKLKLNKLRKNKRIEKSDAKLISTPTSVKTDKQNDKYILSDKSVLGNKDTNIILDKIYTIVAEAKKEQADDTTSGKDYDYDDDRYLEDLPDYRIIGGNAATSSGAPVSNKGRNGINV